MLRTIGFAVAVFCAPNLLGQEIPLEDIWAYGMIGTKDVRELDPASIGKPEPGQSKAEAFAAFEKSRVEQIHRKLLDLPRDAPQLNGFVVVGADKDAIDGVFRVLVDEEKPAEELPSDKPLTLVFFSAEFGSCVHIESANVDGHTIVVNYQFKPHSALYRSSHFALIPLGALEPGKYEVRVERSTNDKDEFSEWEDKIPCQSFSFTVN